MMKKYMYEPAIVFGITKKMSGGVNNKGVDNYGAYGDRCCDPLCIPSEERFLVQYFECLFSIS
jgi:hypothetical protein